MKNEEKSRPGHNGFVGALRDNAQYFLAFGVIASLLLVASMPIFVVLFFGVFIYFVSKMFSNPGKHRTRRIFEFYLSANDIISSELRTWYGFELNEAITQGEEIVTTMPNAPSLVHFALGSLYNKVGDHSSAVKHLTYVAENPESFESNIVYPSSELRNYVSVLRKIEREPGDAPLTSAAVRSLESLRKTRTEELLEESRSAVKKAEPGLMTNGNAFVQIEGKIEQDDWRGNGSDVQYFNSAQTNETEIGKNGNGDTTRKPITEVLHDIYDRKIQ